jgi:hypothetical protein
MLVAMNKKHRIQYYAPDFRTMQEYIPERSEIDAKGKQLFSNVRRVLN